MTASGSGVPGAARVPDARRRVAWPATPPAAIGARPLLGAMPRPLRWRAEVSSALADDPRPLRVLVPGDRVVVECAEVWQLHGDRGTILAVSVLGAGGLAIDGAAGELVYLDGQGLVTARSLADGEETYGGPAPGLPDAERPLLVALDRAVVVVSLAAGSPRGGTRVERIDRRGAGGPPAFEPGVACAQAAAAEGWLALGGPGLLCWVDIATLRPIAAWEGDFAVRSLAVDAWGRTLAVVEEARALSLWVVDADGALALAVALPEAVRPVAAAHPAGRLHLLGVESLFAIDPDGAVAWQRRLGGPVAGAVAVADDELVAAVGSDLLRFDRFGHAVLLHGCREPLCTPPVVAGDQDVVVASAQHVFRVGGPTE